MIRILLLLLVLPGIQSCKQEEKNPSIIIEGNVRDLPEGRLYLSDARHWRIPLDSAEVKNGHFQFRIPFDTNFIPYKAVIHFTDSSKEGSIGTLWFRNDLLEDRSKTMLNDGFYVEPGQTRIEGTRDSAKIYAGKETELLFRNQLEDFGWLGLEDSIKRQARLDLFRKEIRQNPGSYFLLESIYRFKEHYYPAELEELLSLFDKKIAASSWADSLRANLGIRKDFNRPIDVVDPSGNALNYSMSREDLNVIVFWASWCSPCRREIPMLKTFYSANKNKKVKLVSISIDQDSQHWKQALTQEKMEWPQFLVAAGKIDYVMQQFNFTTIPFTLFIDKDGKVIRQSDGFDDEPLNLP